jgi:hypothetical protein
MLSDATKLICRKIFTVEAVNDSIVLRFPGDFLNLGLYCINGVVIAALMHCDLFKIYCATPNIGITRT